MAKYIAFLKAINVGGHTVKMDHLKSLFEKIGFEMLKHLLQAVMLCLKQNLKQ